MTETSLTPEELRARIAALGAEPAACLVCETPTPRRLFERDGKWFWRCRACELIFVHDIYPEYVADVSYLAGTGAASDARGAKPKQRRDYARLLDEFEVYRKRNRLLEVGCAAGLFLNAAAARGWQPSGVEVLADIARLAREHRGLDVRTGELAEAGFAEGEFDVVYMNEVIEHIIDPVALLREVHRVLRPGGLALLRTGNARSWAARWRGRHWHYYRFGGLMHIRVFSPRAAEALARAAGFASVRAQTRGFAFRESAEARGRWFKPFMQVAQACNSPLAGPCGAGHRLTMRFERGQH
jgi:SAM-dependent methyltransferase